MRIFRFLTIQLICVLTLSFFSSCAGIPRRFERGGELPEYVLGQGSISPGRLASFLIENNASLETIRATELAALYVEEAAIEGVNHDVAFAQMFLETGALRFGGLVTADMHNYCGLGSIGPEKPGERFPDARTGVRAHIQHLKAYATSESPKLTIVDPRYRWVRYGTAPSIAALSGKWASDPQYGTKITGILGRLYGISISP